MSINKAILVGNVGNDPEIRTMNHGGEVAQFSLATSESWNDKATGERRERTEWHRVVIFSEGLVSIVKRFVHKGSRLYIEGAIQTRKWTDQQGNERYTTEIVLQSFQGTLKLLDSRQSSESEPGSGTRYNASPSAMPSMNATSFAGSGAGSHSASGFAHDTVSVIDDEIPF